MPQSRKPRAFGSVRKLPSGRYQASYLDDDGKRINAPMTFPKQRDGEEWLAIKQSEKVQGIKGQKAKDPRTLAAYIQEWMSTRTVDGKPLAPTTLETYQRHNDLHIAPNLGHLRLVDITPEKVRSWYAALPNKVGPYRLLRAVLATAVEDDILAVNPCKVKTGAKQNRAERPAMSPADVIALSEAMSPQYKAMVLVGAFGGLRIGELVGLQRQDIDFEARTIHVRRQQQWVNKTWIVCPPKSERGIREAAPMPDVVWDSLARHLSTFVKESPTAWVFTTSTGAPPLRSSFKNIMLRAAKKHVFPHLMRHTAAILLAENGATPGELMSYFGWSKMETAAIYLNKARDERRSVLAGRMNATVATVLPSPPSVVDINFVA